MWLRNVVYQSMYWLSLLWGGVILHIEIEHILHIFCLSISAKPEKVLVTETSSKGENLTILYIFFLNQIFLGSTKYSSAGEEGSTFHMEGGGFFRNNLGGG